MKTEWTFRWRAHDFRFSKEHNFIAAVNEATPGTPDPIDGLEMAVKIVPADDEQHARDPNIQQWGDLLVTVPMRPEAAEPLAYAAAHAIGEQIAFRNGDFRVDYGFVSCRRIPENSEEEAEVGDEPYTVRLHLTEVGTVPEFDGGRIADLGKANVEMLAQYNQTKRDDNPIRQFLGFFRIIETSSYGSDARRPLKQTIKENAFLRRHFLSLLPNDSFDEYVNTIVEIRAKCAHWKSEVGFGYSPTDPAVKEEVLPELQLIQELAYRCVEGTEP